MHCDIQYRIRGEGMVGPYKKAIQRKVACYSPVGDTIRNKSDLTSPNISFVLSPIYHSLILFCCSDISQGAKLTLFLATNPSYKAIFV